MKTTFCLVTLLASICLCPAQDAGPADPAEKAASDARTAENILLYQRDSGGWPKNYDRRQVLNESQRQGILRNKSENDAMIDNGATHTEIRLLAQAFQTTRDQRFKTAALRGIHYLLSGQYDNGGWPQKFPNPRGYSRYITFNDNAMIGVMNLLRDIAGGDEVFSFVSDDSRDLCRRAVQRGIEVILKCQIRVAGVPTVWCAQHDHVTLEPRKARSYELASLSGSESSGIVRFLMEIEDPSDEVIRAIENAVRWFERSKLEGIKLVRVEDPTQPRGFDKVVVEDPAAPPMWARFYDIDTNQPIFCSRDGVPRRHLSDISHERRNGYSWLGSYARRLLERDYPSWKRRMERTTLVLAEKPNLIYILTDDLGYGDLGCYGQKVIETPRIDRMAREGLRFTDHYAGHTVCRPSRLSLLTGLHTGHTTIAGNDKHILPGGSTTVTSLLKSAGYTTGGSGKWALGHNGSTGHPNRQGFDFFYGWLDQSEAHNYYPEVLYRNGEAERLPGNVLSGERNVSSKKVTYAHTRVTDEALDFIRRNRNTPFYLNLSWTIPHTNNEAGRVEGNGQEIPDHGIYKDKDWPDPEKGFAAMVTLMDRDTGRILDLLTELGIEERTLVIFTSDNGPHQEGGHKVEFFDSNGKLRGYKRSLHDGGIRVPMIAWWPGSVKPGVTDHVSAFWDWLPTACELAGIAVPEGLDGVSFAPLLLGDPENQKQHEQLFWRWNRFRAVRMGRWKGVQTDDVLAVYDLEKDIGEETDLAKLRPDLVEMLARAIAREETRK